MDEGASFDLKNLESLRRDLKELRAKAQQSGRLDAPDAEVPGGPGGLALHQPGGRQAVAPGERGKQLASRLLTLLRRAEDDDSPAVPGTDFTEEGVERLLDRLALPPKRLGAADQFLQNMYRYLTAPARKGAPMVADVSVDKLQYLSRLLQQIEKHGWDQVRSRLAQRRDRSGTAAAAADRPQPGKRGATQR